MEDEEPVQLIEAMEDGMVKDEDCLECFEESEMESDVVEGELKPLDELLRSQKKNNEADAESGLLEEDQVSTEAAASTGSYFGSNEEMQAINAGKFEGGDEEELEKLEDEEFEEELEDVDDEEFEDVDDEEFEEEEEDELYNNETSPSENDVEAAELEKEKEEEEDDFNMEAVTRVEMGKTPPPSRVITKTPPVRKRMVSSGLQKENIKVVEEDLRIVKPMNSVVSSPPFETRSIETDKTKDRIVRVSLELDRDAKLSKEGGQDTPSLNKEKAKTPWDVPADPRVSYERVTTVNTSHVIQIHSRG